MKSFGILGCAVLFTMTGFGATGNAVLKDLDKVANDNSITLGTDNNYYWEYFFQFCSDARRAEIVEKNLAAQKKRLEIDGANVKYRIRYADALLRLDRYKEALPHYEAVIANAKNAAPSVLANAMYGKAECLYGLGRKAEALKQLKELVARKITRFARGEFNATAQAQTAIRFLEGMNQDERGLPVWSDAKAFPEPQKAEYTEEFVPVRKVGLTLEGVKSDDARVKLLETKLKRFGIGIGRSGDFKLTVSLSAKAPVDKPEGYSLQVEKGKGAKIAARDLQGVLWGVVSFLQLIDPEKKAVRVCRIDDWPDCAKRGYLCRQSDFHCEFALFAKMNSVCFQDNTYCHGDRFTPLAKMMSAEQARQFKSYGLDFYYGIAWATMYPKLPITEERTYKKHLEICNYYASIGAGVYFPFDDARFPLHERDLAAAKKGADIDAKHVNRLYREVKKAYPDFKMVFCPPFYWGPDSKASYPEPREPYLKSVGANLDPAVDCYWTGPRVKGYNKNASQVKWYSDLIGRKPAIFQNATGAHNQISCGVDATDWHKWHYPGFTKDIAMFHLNTNYTIDGPMIWTLGDYLWNEAAYRPGRSIRVAVGNLVGKGAYDIPNDNHGMIAYFDKYKYGEVNSNIENESLPDLETRVAKAHQVWERIWELGENARRYLGGFGWCIGYADTALAGARKHFNSKHRDALTQIEKAALADGAYHKSKGERLLSPIELAGAEPAPNGSRLSRTVSAGRDLSGRFECDPFPPSGPYELEICGAGVGELTLKVNDKPVGKAVFAAPGFTTVKVSVPFETMVRYNAFTLTGASSAPVAVNYIVVRRK